MPVETITPASAEPAPLQGTTTAPAVPLLQAQAIHCGGVAIAVPFSWARMVVEAPDVNPAPNAPVWLAGAVNVEGHILPVLDLAAWLDEQAAQAIGRDSKILVGGEGEDRFALLFQGLPMMVRYAPDATAQHNTEAALAPFVVGAAVLAVEQADRRWPVIDMRALGEQWIAELVV